MIRISPIKETLKNIYPLIIKGEDHFWAEPIRRWYVEINHSPEDTIRTIIRCSCGFGSLSDTHITREDKILEQEDEEFCILRDQLFQLCVDALPEISRSKSSDHPDAS